MNEWEIIRLGFRTRAEIQSYERAQMRQAYEKVIPDLETVDRTRSALYRGTPDTQNA